jgi:hypothetical protein
VDKGAERLSTLIIALTVTTFDVRAELVIAPAKRSCGSAMSSVRNSAPLQLQGRCAKRAS